MWGVLRFGGIGGRGWLLGTALLAALAAGLLSAPTAQAKREIRLGTADPRYVADPHQRRVDFFRRSRASGVQVIRINAFWFQVAPTRPLRPRDPTDPAYDFRRIDAAVRLAHANGILPFITLQRAPEWAESGPNGEDRGAWKPSPAAFGDYAAALARRYSGNHPDPLSPTRTLPRVRHFQLWNEGNLFSFLAPQRERGQLVGPFWFRRLVNRGYHEVKAVSRRNRVIAGGTAPVGPNNRNRTEPVTFWRKVLCLDRRLEPIRRCNNPLRFDVFDHHPINRAGGPRDRRAHWVTIRNFGQVRRVLRAAERHRTVRPRRVRRPIWATEFYWETNPPDKAAGFAPMRAGRYLADGIYLLWRKGVSVGLNFFLVDPELTEPGSPSNVQGGLFYAGSEGRKPSFTAFRFPFVTDTRRGRTIGWGRPPRSGRAKVEIRRRGRWRTIRTPRVRSRRHFIVRLPELRRGTKLRARVRGKRSLVWKHRFR